jgi:hypothetical protein
MSFVAIVKFVSFSPLGRERDQENFKKKIGPKKSHVQIHVSLRPPLIQFTFRSAVQASYVCARAVRELLLSL